MTDDEGGLKLHETGDFGQLKRPDSRIPDVSVVLPVKNGAETIEAQLRALAGQLGAPSWELIVSDNGSVDETVPIIESLRPLLAVAVKVVDSGNRAGAGHARNVGTRSARGKLILTCDADDVVHPDWIAAMVAALSQADIVGGAMDHKSMNPQNSSVGHRGWTTSLEDPWGFLPFASGANTAFRREVFDGIYGWDVEFLIAQDVDFSWRAQLAGFLLVFEPRAKVSYRHRVGLRSKCRQAYRYARAVPQLYRRYRSAGMSRSSGARIIKIPVWLLMHLPDLMREQDQREGWFVIASVWLGRLVGSARNRVWYP